MMNNKKLQEDFNLFISLIVLMALFYFPQPMEELKDDE